MVFWQLYDIAINHKKLTIVIDCYMQSRFVVAFEISGLYQTVVQKSKNMADDWMTFFRLDGLNGRYTLSCRLWQGKTELFDETSKSV